MVFLKDQCLTDHNPISGLHVVVPVVETVSALVVQLQSPIWIPVVFCSAFRTGMAKKGKIFVKTHDCVVHKHFVCSSFEKIQAGLLQNLLFFLDEK